AIGPAVELGNQLCLQFRSKTFLEGHTVGNERFQANRHIRSVVLDSFLGAKMPQGEGGFWVREVRSKSIGLKQHSFGHVFAPRIHGAAKDAEWDRSRLQMSCKRQTVRASTDDGYFRVGNHGRLNDLLSASFESLL